MKNLISLPIISLFVAGCLLLSCGEQSARQLQFGETAISKKEHLFADESKPACNLSVNLEYVSNASTPGAKDSLNTYLLSAALGNKYSHTAPQEAIEGFAKEYIKDYRNDLEPMIKKDIESQIDNDQLTAWYSYELKIEGSVETYVGELLTYRTYKEEYSGGPHGMYTTEFINIDLTDLHQLQLDELFLEDYQETLTELLWYQLALDNGVENRDELEEMGYATTGELAPIENFFLSTQGITFYYNVYEIAPYSMGPTQITLPFGQLEYILNYDNPIIKEFTAQWN